MGIEHFYAWLIAFFGVLATLGVFWKQITGLCGGLYRVTKGTVKFFVTVSQTHDRIERIYKEVIPNSGGSMNDKLTRVENTVIRSEARKEAEFNLDATARWETDEGGNIIRVNRRFSEIVGRSSDDLTGANWKNTIHPDDLARVTQEWMGAVIDKRDSLIHHRIVRPTDRQIVEVIGRGEMMSSPQGEVLGWTGTLTPVPPKEDTRGVVSVRRPHVLFVEDNPDTRHSFFLGLGVFFDTVAASSGKDAIQAFGDAQQSGRPFTVIVMDVAMPGMDGIETVRRIRGMESERGSTLVVFFTGNKDSVNDDMIQELDVAKVIEKPMMSQDLAAKLSLLMGQRI